MENKHGVQKPISQQQQQLNTSFMQSYPQSHHEQVIQQQQPIYQREIPPPPHTQISPQQNGLVVRNQYLQNKVNELQTFIRNQNVQTGRKRFRSNNEDDDETLMETDEPDFLSESDSEESDIDVGQELEDIITDINISFTNIVSLRKQYLQALEKYNEIEDEDKTDIFKKYIKLKGKLWMEWYDYNEDDEEEEDDEEDDEEEEEDESEDSVTDKDGEEGDEEEGDGEEESEEEGEDGEDQDHDKNHIMDFVLQLESVADKDDKTEIERLWKKQLNGIALLKDAQIDSKETDSEDEDDDSLDTVIKNKDEIEKIVEEFDERGNNYFKHCNKEKIETICNWCNELLNKESELFKDKANLNKVKKVLRPVGRKVEKLANSEYPISKQRKLLQEVQVGNGIMGALKTVVLPFLTKLVRNFV